MTSLRKRMIEDMQVRNRSPHTQASYVQQVSLFARFFDKSPELLGPEDIRTYQVFLTNEKRLTPKSISVAVAALRFLYNVTLKKEWTIDEVLPHPKQPQREEDRAASCAAAILFAQCDTQKVKSRRDLPTALSCSPTNGGRDRYGPG
ncbi:MAG: site-specific integrase, partial [Rhodoplanes sp.]